MIPDFSGAGMTDVGFTALCRYAPADSLRFMSIWNNKITKIPAEFRRFEKLTMFFAHDNDWDEEWRYDNREISSNASSALKYARGLVSDGENTNHHHTNFGNHSKFNTCYSSFTHSPIHLRRNR
jgi:hypothetical protein